jgi:pimeloyl-ACP methyl ester carboxylesterase
LKKLAPVLGISVDKLRDRFGSADNRAAGALRETFRKVIADDLEPELHLVEQPVRLIYGVEDNETPPEMGRRFERLIPNAELTVLPDQDHYTVLTSGRHVVQKKLAEFLETF